MIAQVSPEWAAIAFWASGSRSEKDTDIMTPAAKPKEQDTIFSLFDFVKKIIIAPSSVEIPAKKEMITAAMVC